MSEFKPKPKFNINARQDEFMVMAAKFSHKYTVHWIPVEKKHKRARNPNDNGVVHIPFICELHDCPICAQNNLMLANYQTPDWCGYSSVDHSPAIATSHVFLYAVWQGGELKVLRAPGAAGVGQEQHELLRHQIPFRLVGAGAGGGKRIATHSGSVPVMPKPEGAQDLNHAEYISLIERAYPKVLRFQGHAQEIINDVVELRKKLGA